MSIFTPTGPSMMIQLMGGQKQIVELPANVSESPVLRLVSTVHPSSTVYTFVALGDASVDVAPASGMPIDLTGRQERFLPVSDGQSNIAMIMGGASGAFTIYLTPGRMVD